MSSTPLQQKPSRKPKRVKHKPIMCVTDPDNYKAAGVAFTNGRHVLGGYQPHKKHPSISGIGGVREDGETYMQTALRECIEELFGIASISESLVSKLATIVPYKIIQSASGSYINVIYTFANLHTMLKYIHQMYESPFYKKFPKTITELIMNREVISGEITHLALLPVLVQSADTFMDPYFVADMASFKTSY
jgi:hypothetical protein